MIKNSLCAAIVALLTAQSASMAAEGPEPCACGGPATKTWADVQFRLDRATLEAMGAPAEELAPPTRDLATVRKELQGFSRAAAKFATRQAGGDKRLSVRLFRDMVVSRSEPELAIMRMAPGAYARVQPFNVPDWEGPFGRRRRVGLMPEDFLAEESFVESASALVNDIAMGEVPFIIDGVDDVDNEFPDCVAIGNQHLGFFCTGTLVAPNLVVTAHHCSPDSISHIFIGLNAPDGPFDPDDVEGGHVYAVADTRVHPDVGNATGPPHDILVLVLAENVDPAHAEPRAVATVDEAVEAKWAWIAGYGVSIIDPVSSGFGTRRKTPVPLIPACLVSEAVAGAFGCHYKFEFATGNMFGRASCFGDSGGPIFVIVGDAGELKLAGAVSRALPPGTRVGHRICGLGAINTLVSHPEYASLRQ
jgi:hypothetical protein